MNINLQNKLLAYIKYHKINSNEYLSHGKEFLKGLLNTILSSTNILYTKPTISKTDILFIHNNKNAPNRLSGLLSKLKNQNIKIEHEYFLFDKKILKKLSNPGYKVNKDLILFAAYAKYVIAKYQPKIVVTFMNSSLISPFIREEMNGKGIYVNISHSVTPNSSGDSITDFDYYLLFGQSSLDNLSQNPVRIGNTNIILTGSPFVNFSNKVDNGGTQNPNNILFFSTNLTNSKEGEILKENTKIVIEWAKKYREYNLFIKTHPLEDPAWITNLTINIPNIKILSKDITFSEAMKNISIVLNSWSNASIEAAILGKPTVIINTSDLHDEYLKLEKFFLPKTHTPEEITEKIKETISNYPYFVNKAKEFSHYHLHRLDSIDYIAEILINLNNNNKPENTIYLEENLLGLYPFLR